MAKAINLSVNNKLGNEPLIIILANSKEAIPSWSISLIKVKGGDSLLESIKQIIVSKPKLGTTWNIKTNKGWDVSIVASGNGDGETPLTRLALDKLNKKVAAIIKQRDSKFAQLLCEGLVLDKTDLSLQGNDRGDGNNKGNKLDNYALDSIICGIADAAYSYDEFKSKKNNKPLEKLTILCQQPDSLSQRIKRLGALLKGVYLAKELANAPPNLCNPPYLAAQGKSLAKQYSKVSCKLLGEKEMKKLKMGAYLAVTDGSSYPPQLVIMEYKGSKNRNDKPVVLVGKGMTFDTGGVSIKPSAKMDEMKYDMCGAASVFGVMKFVAELSLPINLVAMAVGAENSVDGKSYRPGDIIKTMSGKSVEVLNTDAEGRLVLCDTLTLVARYKPRYVVDIATLTGACVIALGHLRSGMFANDDDLASKLEIAGARSQDLVWRLPLDKTYMEDMNTNFADLANVGGRSAGTITAAGFLAEFTTAYPWAHLDIAGTAWLEGAAKGATGRPVALLSQLILDGLTE